MILVLLWACWSDPPPPSLAPIRETLAAYEAGRAALDDGRGREAAQRFEAARGARHDPLLKAWEAHARARDGQLAEAERLLREVLDERPGFQLARYNLGCVLARQGRQEEAAAEVGVALVGGVVAPRQAARDPDIAPHLADPAWDLLPDEPLGAVLTVPDAVAFWGTEATITLVVQGVSDDPLELVGAGVTGPVALLGVVEDTRVDALGDTERVWTWTVRVEGEGEVVVGPLSARQGTWATQAVEGRFPTAAPSGRRGAPVAVALPVPSDVGDPGAAPTVIGDVVLAPPGCRISGDLTWTGARRAFGVTRAVLGGLRGGRVTARCGAEPDWTWPAP